MKKLFTCLLVVLMTCTLVACGGNNSEAAPEASDTALKLGCSGPLTGSTSVYGIDVKNAVDLAIEEINAKEGKEFFAFNMQDDVADPEKSPSAYGALKDWGMQISLLTVTSGAGAAVAPDYAQDHIFALTPSGSNTSLVYSDTTNYETNFQMCFTDPNLGVGSADYIKTNNLGSKVGIIYKSDDNYSTGIYEKFVEQSKKVGLEVVEVQSFDEATSTDFSAQLQTLQTAGCDLVFLPIYYTPASIILTQAKAAGFAPKFFGVDGLDGILGLEGFDTTLAEGVYLLTPFAADAQDDLTKSFVSAFNSKFNSTPTQFAADAYDCVYAIYQACKNANITPDMETSAITDALIAQFSSMQFKGLTGDCTWASNGEVSKSPKAVIINNGVYVSAE